MKRKLNLKEKALLFVKRYRRSTSKHVLAVLVIVVLTLVFLNMFSDGSITIAERDEDDIFVAMFAADMFLGDNVRKVTQKQGYDYLFKYVKPYFEASDYITGYYDDLNKVYKSEEHSSFEDVDTVKALKDMKYNVLSLSSGYDLKQLKSTIDMFSSAGIDCVGTEVEGDTIQKISYHTTGGIKVATVGIIDIYNQDKRKKVKNVPLPDILYKSVIKEAKDNSDLVIVHINWGEEYVSKVSKRQKEMAKAISDAGADIIIGHNSYVLQPIEIYNDTLIFYSLGNLFNDQIWTNSKESILVRYCINKDGTETVEVVLVHSRGAQPRPMTGLLNWFGRQKNFLMLTKYLPDNSTWDINDEKLIIYLNR